MCPDNSTTGPSWLDVRETLHYVELEHECQVAIMLFVATTPIERRRYLRVMVQAHEGYKMEVRNVVCTKAADWPTSSSRTMPGLLYSLLIQLDQALQFRQLSLLSLPGDVLTQASDEQMCQGLSQHTLDTDDRRR